ncbi:MAG: adenylyl-sulfate kinase [Gammaproteobacteria bacterium]|nr:adenylyl-sulfate kinase [Gammaproteobacteria bacterium]
MVIWITGLSGAGKSTLSKHVVKRLRATNNAVALLDGDDIRDVIQDRHTAYDKNSRLVNAYRICRFARLLSQQGLHVVVATLSLFHEIHQWNRNNLCDYFEVFLQVELDRLKQRDPKGLYRHAQNGVIQNVMGIHLEIEVPLQPNLIINNNTDIDNNNTQNFNCMVDQIIQGAMQVCAANEGCQHGYGINRACNEI